MDRREILVAFGRVAVVAAAIPAIAQRAKITRVGFLSGASRPVSIQTSVFGSFLRGMRELGYTEDKDFTVEWRFADGRYERFPALAHELISLKVDLIVTGTIAAIESVQRLTTVIPIVNGGGGDPVAQGFASSYARPGGNVTGIASSITEASSKYIELLRTLLPKLSKIAVLANPGNISGEPRSTSIGSSKVQSLRSWQSNSR